MTNLFSEYRRRAGLTQKQVGDYIGISSQAVSKWENGQTEPDIDALCKLASLYNTTVDELVGKNPKIKCEEEQEPVVSKIPSPTGWIKNGKKKLIVAITIILAVTIIFALICCSSQESPKSMLEKYEKIELGMTMSEVEKILGEPEEKVDKYFDDDDYFSAAFAVEEYGYRNADFWYYRDSQYDLNVKADINFDLDYEFKPYCQIRVTFDSEGKVIEAYYNTQTNYFALLDDYGGGDDKTATNVDYLKKDYTGIKNKEKVKITFDDGSVYLGEVEIITKSGNKVIEHPWADITVG